MKLYRPLLYVVALSLSQASHASSIYKDYRLGNYTQSFKALDAQSSKDPVADFYLGNLYLYGYGQLKNKSLAIRYFTQSAEKGYLPAQMFMAQYALQVKNNPEKALVWFKKAADNGSISAKLYVVGAYLYGFGTKKTPDRARRYYIDAAKMGNPLAQYTLAEHFLDSRHSSNRRLGLIWLNKAAEEGHNPKAEAKLGELYFEGKVVKSDPVAAVSWLNKAVSQGYVPAMVVLGDMALKQNTPAIAEQWYEKAAKLKNTTAQYKLARMYLDEKNPLHDTQKGFLWTLKASESGSIEAQKQLANLYKNGVGVKANEQLSQEWLKKADKQAKKADDLPAKVLMARWLSNDSSDTIDEPQYQALGIVSGWSNKAAKRDMIYNQSPQMEQYTKEDLFKPQFILTQPNEVPINAYYDALIKADSQFKAKQWHYPVYPLSKHLKAQLEANSPILRKHTQILPYADTYPLAEITPSNIDWLSQWNPDWRNTANYMAIFNELYGRALLGNSNAQFRIGQMFQYGLGVFQSEQQAITYYEKAAAQQNMAAQYAMGLLYLKHQDDPELYLRGVNWLTDAAFKGNAFAQYAMVNIFQDQPGRLSVVSPHEEQALSMLYLSAANGYGVAQYELAEQLTHNRGADLSVAAKKERRALIRQLYQHAAQQGVAQAYLPLAFFNAMDKDPQAQQHAFDVAKAQAEAGNPRAFLLLGILYDRGIGVGSDSQIAMEWYQKAGDSAVSRFIVGTYMLEGKGISKDKDKAQIYLQQSADANFSYAAFNLAILAHQSGEHFLPELIKAYDAGNSKAGLLLADYSLAKKENPETLDRALSIYSGLANKGDQYAQLKLAYMYEHGIGTQPNEEQAFKWYKASAEQENPIAQYQLGQWYQLGYGSHPNYSQALAWYTKAANAQPKASVAIGFIDETVYEQYGEAKKAYEKASAKGDEIANYNLGLIYEYGKGEAVNYEKAVEYYSKAADKGIAPAMTQLAGLYFYGLGVQRNTNEALSWYKKAAVLSQLDAIYKLGLLSETGVSTKLDYQAAIRHYKQAAAMGHEKAMIALARMYQYGFGVEKNSQEAMKLYRHLAERNNAYAQYQLATFYLDGTAGERMPEKAKKWLKNASQNGSAEARKVLRTMEAQAQGRVSFIEPALMNTAPILAGQPADLVYFDALSEWNRGDEVLSRMMLHRLISEFPNYMPAKKVYEQLNKSLATSFYG